MIRCSYLCACMEASDTEEYGALRQEARGVAGGLRVSRSRFGRRHPPAAPALWRPNTPLPAALCIVTSRTANKRIISSLLMTV